MPIDTSSISSLLNPGATSLVGVNIGSSAVKMVELSKNRSGSYRVEGYAVEPLPKGAVQEGTITKPDAVASVMSRCWKRIGTSTKNLAMALPTSSVITKQFALPAGMSEGEIEIQVESEAAQYIPFAPEEMSLDFQVLGPSADGTDEDVVLIAAARREHVEDLQACAEGAKLKAAVVSVESFALLAAFELVRDQFPGSVMEQVFCLVDIGAHNLTVTIQHGNDEVFRREQAFGCDQLTQDIARVYGMSHDEAESYKRAGSMPENFESELLLPFLDSLGHEISRALQNFFASSQYNEVDHIILMGGGALLPGVAETVEEQTKVATALANPFARMAVAKGVHAPQLLTDAPALMAACGLAMRGAES